MRHRYCPLAALARRHRSDTMPESKAKAAAKVEMNIQAARTTSAEPVLLRENSGPVAVLTLNRPAARNSLSEALLGMLGDALGRYRQG